MGKEYENNKNPTRKHTFSYNNNISYITYEVYIEEDGAYRDIHSGIYSYSNGELWIDEDSSIKLYSYWLSDNTNINFVYDEYNNLIRSEDKTDSSIVGIYNYIETDSSYISDEIITINKLLTKLFTDYISHLSMTPYF